jgi:hypothetical protein
MDECRVHKIFFLALIFAAIVFPLTAQDIDSVEDTDDVEIIEDEGSYEDDDYEDGEGDENAGLPITSDWSGSPLSGYTRGDQTFNISLGVIVPLFFLYDSGDLMPNKVFVGGVGSLAYNYFVNSNLFFGAVMQGSFSQTFGKNFLYLIPVGITAGYQFVVKRFEFPLSITIGGMTEQYFTYNGYWLFLKPQVSGFFRFNSDWSFGLNLAWWYVPQWTNTPEKNATGNFMEITLSARYHF